MCRKAVSGTQGWNTTCQTGTFRTDVSHSCQRIPLLPFCSCGSVLVTSLRRYFFKCHALVAQRVPSQLVNVLSPWAFLVRSSEPRADREGRGKAGARRTGSTSMLRMGRARYRYVNVVDGTTMRGSVCLLGILVFQCLADIETVL